MKANRRHRPVGILRKRKQMLGLRHRQRVSLRHRQRVVSPAHAKGGSQGRAKGGSPAKPKAKAKGKLTDGVRLKAKYSKAMSAAAALESSIEVDGKWAWRKEQKADKQFNKTLHGMKTAAASNEFARTGLSKDQPVLKTMHGEI